jgi:hypothetical protein
MRDLNLQFGTYSNWVGAHYWSSFPTEPEERLPLFVCDSANAIGSILGSEAPCHETDFSNEFDKIDKIERPVPASSWTDIWELSHYPRHSLYVPSASVTHDNPFNFFNRSRVYSADFWDDETNLRNLLENFDNSIFNLNNFSNFNFSNLNLAAISYLIDQHFPRMNIFNVVNLSPLEEDNTVTNLANDVNFIFTNYTLSGLVGERVISVPFPPPGASVLESSGIEANWLLIDQQIKWRPTEHRVLFPLLNEVYPAEGSVGQAERFRLGDRIRRLGSNNPWNRRMDEEIHFGYKIPNFAYFDKLENNLKLFQKNYKNVYENSTESDEFIKMSEYISSIKESSGLDEDEED